MDTTPQRFKLDVALTEYSVRGLCAGTELMGRFQFWLYFDQAPEGKPPDWIKRRVETWIASDFPGGRDALRRLMESHRAVRFTHFSYDDIRDPNP